jgi:hypothetical protein
MLASLLVTETGLRERDGKSNRMIGWSNVQAAVLLPVTLRVGLRDVVRQLGACDSRQGESSGEVCESHDDLSLEDGTIVGAKERW